jgi:anti-sigma factor RsiW
MRGANDRQGEHHMNNHWHEQIQRHMNGQSSAEESAALCEALKRDADLRALYLDYMNLDAALGAMAEAEAAAVFGTGGPATIRPAKPRPGWHRWLWLAPSAASAALVIFFGVIAEHRAASPSRPDIGELTSSARSAISRLRPDMPPPIPAWMSPTAPLLGEPGHPH